MTKLNKVKVKTVSWIGGIAAVSLLAPTIVLLTQNTSHTDVGPEIEFDFTKGQKFTPVVERKQDSTPYNTDKALAAYLHDINENKTIGASDALLVSQFIYNSFVDEKFTINQFTKKFEVLSVDESNSNITTKINVVYDVDMGIPVQYSMDLTFSNIKYVCDYNDSVNDKKPWKWEFKAEGENYSDADLVKYLGSNKDWTVNGTWSCNMAGMNINATPVDINFSNFEKDPFFITLWSTGMVYQEIRFGSDYFNNIEYTK